MTYSQIPTREGRFAGAASRNANADPIVVRAPPEALPGDPRLVPVPDLRNRLVGWKASAATEKEIHEMGELWQLSATEAVNKLRKGEVSPLEMVEAAAARIAAVEPKINALPIRFIDEARSQARASAMRPTHIRAGSPACRSPSRTTTTSQDS